MNTVVNVHMKGQPNPFRIHGDAYDALKSYLEGARVRLGEGADASEVVDDLERSLGERLAAMAGPSDRILEAMDVASALEAVGAVEEPSGRPAVAPRFRKRRLYRIKEGQEWAGVCRGIAVYADVGVDWVRTIFIFATVLTAGLFLIVYLVLVFVLPVLPTKAAWFAEMEATNQGDAA